MKLSGARPARASSGLRVVAAGLGVAVIPRQVVLGNGRGDVVAVALADAWAQRSFAICYRSADALQPAAARLKEFLVERAATERGAADAAPAPRRR